MFSTYGFLPDFMFGELDDYGGHVGAGTRKQEIGFLGFGFWVAKKMAELAISRRCCRLGCSSFAERIAMAASLL